MKKYNLVLTEKQLSIIQRACEFYSRFLAGQWEIPQELQWKEFEMREMPDNFWDIRNQSQDIIHTAKENFFNGKLSRHAIYGIGNKELSEYAKIAYDIYRPILEQFTKENREAGNDTHMSVYDSPGFSYSKEGRITIKLENDGGSD